MAAKPRLSAVHVYQGAAGALVTHSVLYVLPDAQEAASPGAPPARGLLLRQRHGPESTGGSLEGNRPIWASPRAVRGPCTCYLLTELALLVPRKQLQFEFSF